MEWDFDIKVSLLTHQPDMAPKDFAGTLGGRILDKFLNRLILYFN